MAAPKILAFAGSMKHLLQTLVHRLVELARRLA